MLVFILTLSLFSFQSERPSFEVIQHNDEGFDYFNRKIVVFGIDIYAAPGVEEERLLHAANVMAQYLDNDEDGMPDNQLVLDSMRASKAFMIMWEKPKDLRRESSPRDREGQDLGNDETQPEFVASGMTGRFDASLEEVLHIITHAGYAKAYPEIFGEEKGTSIANAMDQARGGHHKKTPRQYPESSWYSYNDRTCDYACQITEYHYWALTSLLGAQINRSEEINDEWRLNTPELLSERDTAIYEQLTDPKYAFPKVLPDGRYGL